MRKDHAHQFIDALLRSEERRDLRRRREREGHSARRIPQNVRHGLAGELSGERNGRLEHRLRQRARHPCAGRGGGEGGVLRLFHQQSGTRVRYGAFEQRERFAGGAATFVHRPRDARRPAHADFGRGDLEYRYDDGNAHPARVREDHGGAHVLHRRAPPFHHFGCRPHFGDEPRLGHRAGHARAADGAQGILLQSLQFAVCEVM